MRELAGEVHGDLPRECDGLGTPLGAHVGELDAEEVGGLPLDLLDGDDFLFFAPEIREDFLGEIGIHVASAQGAEGDHAGEGALDLADIGFDATGDQISDVIREQDALDRRLFLEDGDAGLEVRWLNVGNEAPLEAGAKALLDLGNLLGWRVGGEDDLMRAS